MRRAQTLLWETASEFERLTGCEIDTTQDLQDVDVEELMSIKE